MDNAFEIRLIEPNDVPLALEIYRPYVLHTAITFEYEVPTIVEFTEKMETITAEYPWLVCFHHGKMVGYAYAAKFRTRAAYQWSPESTIYMATDFQGRGVGRVLYETLFEVLRLQGYYNVYAGLLIPNEKSERLHKSTGFKEVGVYEKVGYKLGKWHDTKWFQLALRTHSDHPELPIKIAEIVESDALKAILQKANESLAVVLQ